jgi:hypothetical protein
MPIESIFGTVQFIISALISYKLYLSTKKNPENINIKYFFFTFLLLSVVFLFSSISIVSIINFRIDFLISAATIIGRGLVLLSIMFFSYISLNILKDKFWKTFLPFLILSVASFSNLFSFVSLFNQPRTPIAKVGNFIIRTHRTDNYTQISLIAVGLVAIFSLGLGIYKYLKVISNSSDEYIFKRGFLLMIAGIFFIFGIFLNYLLTLKFPLLGRVGAEVFYLFALTIFLISILYKKRD